MSIAFVALLAGRLLSRYGIRLGLAANPAGVLVLLIIGAGAGYAGGAASTVFFLVVCAQQITDIALTDGTTRTSVNATYQALPAVSAGGGTDVGGGRRIPTRPRLRRPAADRRERAQRRHRGAGGRDRRPDRRLARARPSPRSRTTAPTSGARSLGGIGIRWRCASTTSRGPPWTASSAGDDLAGLVLGLDLLADTDDPALVPRLRELLADPDPERRLVAVSVTGRSAHRSADSSWAPAALQPLLDDPDEEVRAAVAIALAEFGTDDDRASARRHWAEALVSDDLAAQRTALAAASAGPDAVYAPALLTLAGGAASPPGLADALTANAGSLLPAVDALLTSTDALPTLSVRRLVSALGEARTPEARAVLVAHLDHPDLETADAILEALVAGGPVAADQRPAVRATLEGEAARLAEVLAAAQALDGGAHGAHVHRALSDEAARSRARATGLLGLLHDPTSLARTVGMLEPAHGNRPLALETLEVTVGRGTFPLALALLDPSLEDTDRREQLRGLGFAADEQATVDVLTDIIDDPRRFWRDAWLRACALHMLAGLDPQRATQAAARYADDADRVTAETAGWVLQGKGSLA